MVLSKDPLWDQEVGWTTSQRMLYSNNRLREDWILWLYGVDRHSKVLASSVRSGMASAMEGRTLVEPVDRMLAVIPRRIRV